jgi:hypothetical protein
LEVVGVQPLGDLQIRRHQGPQALSFGGAQ